ALMAFLGGLGTISGPILGALLLEPTQQYFIIQYGVQGYYLVIYGALFLVVILLLPRGVIPTLNERWAKYQAARDQRQQEQGAVLTALPTAGGVAEAVERTQGINL